MKKTLLTFTIAALLIFFLTPDGIGQTSGDYRTTGTGGDWNNTSTWETYNGSSWVNATVSPTTTNDVSILESDIVNVNSNVSCADISVSGDLIFGKIAEYVSYTLNAIGSIEVTASGEISVFDAGKLNEHEIYLSGNLQNNGTISTLATSNDDALCFNFSATTDVTITGNGISFSGLTINLTEGKTAEFQNIIAISDPDDNGFRLFDLQSGIFKLSSASTITPFSGNSTILATSGFYLNHSGANVSWGSSGSLAAKGLLQIDAGTMTIGSSAGNSLDINGSSAKFYMNGGTLNITGYWDQTSSGDANITGGTINVLTNGAIANSQNVVNIPSTCDFIMSGGSFNIKNLNTGSGTLIDVNKSTNSSVSGGTIAVNNVDLVSGNSIIILEDLVLYDFIVDIGSSAVVENFPSDLSIGNNLTITSGTLQIDAGLALTVDGTLTNNAGSTGLLLESDGTDGNAYLIHSTADVPATVENYFTGDAEAWHLFSSPVASQAISGDFTPTGTYPDGTGYDFYMWYELGDEWVNFKNTSIAPTWETANGSNNFVVGRGYLAAYQATNPTKSFSGNLNQGTVNYAMTTGGSGTYGSKNLVGNPYPSSIDWKASSGWGRSNIAESGGGYDMHIYNQSYGNYGAYNSASLIDDGTNGTTRYITSCQGFMVKASATGNISMDNGVRVTNNQAFLKSTNEIQDYLKLKVECPDLTYSDETIIEFHHQTDEGGASKLFSFIAEAPSLYTSKNGENYAINFMGIPNNERVIPLNFEAGVDGYYSITASSLETFAEGTVIILEDTKANSTHELTENPVYEFQAFVNDDPERFKLHFAGSFAIPESSTPEGFNIYSSGKTIYLNSSKEQIAIVNIYNVTGQLIASKPLIVNGLTRFEVQTQTGWYVVKVLINEDLFGKMVFLY